MIALIDTNVVLDVMLDRAPFASDSIAVLAAVETSRCRGMLCASTITTIHYIARRTIGTEESLARLASLLSIFEIAAVNRAVLESAIGRTDMPDFENAVLHDTALQAGANCLVTRNVGDFKNSRILVYTPPQFIEALAAA